MNFMSFLSNLRIDPSWADKNCQFLPLSTLEIVEESGQVRQGGTNNSHIEELKQDIMMKGQAVPITVGEVPLSNGKLPVYDGSHRLKAIRALNAAYPDQERYLTVWATKKEFSSADALVKYQLDANTHLPSKSSSNEDLALALYKRLKTSSCSGVTWKNFNSCENSVERLVEWMKIHWSVAANRGKAIVKRGLKDAPGSKLVNYSKEETIAKFSDLNKFGWSGKKSGEKCNNYVVYPIGSDSHVFPNVSGNSFKKKTSEGRNTKTIAVVWESNTMGKTAEKLNSYRKTVVNKINEANNSWVLASGVKLVDELVFLPQKLKEKKDVLLTSSRDNNGSFTTKFA
mgnify:CR=1 FL=1